MWVESTKNRILQLFKCQRNLSSSRRFFQKTPPNEKEEKIVADSAMCRIVSIVTAASINSRLNTSSNGTIRNGIPFKEIGPA